MKPVPVIVTDVPPVPAVDTRTSASGWIAAVPAPTSCVTTSRWRYTLSDDPAMIWSRCEADVAVLQGQLAHRDALTDEEASHALRIDTRAPVDWAAWSSALPSSE